MQAPLECRTIPYLFRSLTASQGAPAKAYRVEESMENSTDMLTIQEVAKVLRCSKTHVQNALEGKVQGLSRLMHLAMGRRKVIRRDWLQQWMEANKAS
jgi:excisionase family DNA binding protein